ncbi:unnamed protein product [Adineta steineri]|uniref:Pentapeptide repeat-containing protein n=1 Tax=Adineta steineri TaxID=433720 RepID=A0A813PLV1_9BILA|nr:unnamed protein product [Adineta steineri]
MLCSAAIPVALAIYTAIGSQQQKQEAEKTRQFDLEQSKELRQQTLYDEFINNIYKLDKDRYLKERKNPWAFANAYYRAAHRQWDTIRKADVIQFLKEKQLIGRNNCTSGCRTTKLDDIIRLNELSFDNVRLTSETGVLNKLNLQCISFDQVSMSNGEFSSVNLNGASFDGARLDKVKFDGSSLRCASFNGTNLTGAHFSNSDLSNVKLTEDQMKQASFHNITMPNIEKSEITPSTATKKPIIQTTATIIKTEMSTTLSSSSTTTTPSTTTTTPSTTTACNSIFRNQTTYIVGSAPFSVTVADVNSDNKPDIATANGGSNSISVFLNTGNGTFYPRNTYEVGTYPESVAAADVNSDKATALQTPSAFFST